MRCRLLQRLFALLLLIIPTAAGAAADAYRLELILFEPTESGSKEQWTTLEQWPTPIDTVDPWSTINDPITAQPATRLEGVARALTASGRYRVLAHLAWLQPAYPESKARAVAIRGGIEIPGALLTHLDPPDKPATDQPQPTRHQQLEGSATLHVSRFLHLNLNLLLHRPPDLIRPAAEATLQTDSVVITNYRRMRSSELHYIDHPLVAAFAYASRVDE